MAAERSLPLRMMPTWRHMRSRILARVSAAAVGLAGEAAVDAKREIGAPKGAPGCVAEEFVGENREAECEAVESADFVWRAGEVE